jgi:hypothetical protein
MRLIGKSNSFKHIENENGVTRLLRFKMKTTFTLSTHAVERHLDNKNVNASVFNNRRIMYHCVKQCLSSPDIKAKSGKRFDFTKSFPFYIGLSQIRMENTIRVVHTKTKNANFVITAYPVSF